jgi:hypothetical protein
MPVAGRDLLSAVVLITVVGLLAAVVVGWRPETAATDAPYAVVAARWTVSDAPAETAFVGLGRFAYWPNWEGPAQTFDGPVLLQVDEAPAPVRLSFAGTVSVWRAAEGGEPVLTTGPPAATPAASPVPATNEVILSVGDVVAVPAGVGFAARTGDGESFRLSAVAILPTGPPPTPGIPQAEWWAWGTVRPLPDDPLAVTVTDAELAPGQQVPLRQQRGPTLISVEGSGDGAQPIALTVTKGRGSYLHETDVPPWDPSGPMAFVAQPTPTLLNRERPFEGHSGAYLPTGTEARVRNKGLVDGADARIVTIEGPTIATPDVAAFPPTATARPRLTPTATASAPATRTPGS